MFALDEKILIVKSARKYMRTEKHFESGPSLRTDIHAIGLERKAVTKEREAGRGVNRYRKCYGCPLGALLDKADERSSPICCRDTDESKSCEKHLTPARSISGEAR